MNDPRREGNGAAESAGRPGDPRREGNGAAESAGRPGAERREGDGSPSTGGDAVSPAGPTAPPAESGEWSKPPGPSRRRRSVACAAAGGSLAALGIASLVALASNGTWYEPQLVTVAAVTEPATSPVRVSGAASPPASPGSLASTAVAAVALTASGAPPAPAPLPAAFPDLAPRGVYLTVDTWANRLRVYRGGTLLREAVCSTGSGTMLKDPVGGRTWVFDTPLGERRVERKVRNPVWIKPDWAFVEQGFLPPEDFRQRVDDVSLGDYGLYLGDGYIIHGTLFQTLLGRRLTHGCIRLGDEDLEYVYRTAPVGARVFLY